MRLRRPGRPPIAVAEAELADFAALPGAAQRADGLPPRPSLPPVAACALGMWAACAYAFSQAQDLTAAACAAGAGVCAVLAAGAGIGIWRSRAVLAWSLAVGVALGGAVGCAGGAFQHAVAQEACSAAGTFRFEMAQDAVPGAYGTSGFAQVRLPSGAQALVQLRLAGSETLRYGDVLEARVSLEAPQERSSSYCWRNGAVAVARIEGFQRVERGDLLGVLLDVRRRGIAAALSSGEGDGAAVLAALVCGWRGGLDEGGAYEAFKVTGLAHLVAVSGAHLSIVAAFAAALLRAVRAPHALAVAAQAVLILCYLVLAAAPPSAVRAAVMAFAGMGSFAAARRGSSLGSLSACIVAFLVLSPASSLSASFALSALATLGIVLFSGLCAAWVGRAARRMPRMLVDALSLTVASGIVAAPLSASLFAQVSLAAPLANLVVAPLFPLACMGGLAATVAAVLVPAFALPVGVMAGACGLLSQTVCALACIPFASVPASIPLEAALCVSLALSAVLWLAWPAPRARTLAVAAAVAAVCAVVAAGVLPRLAGTQVVMLDVGQGDAFLVRSEGRALLVDTGNQDRLLREALARNGVLRLDAVVVSHADDDHCGSLASLKGVVQVDRVLVARDALECGCAACERLRADACGLAGSEGVAGLAKGDTVRCGAFALEVVWPERFCDDGGNADSLCLLAEADANGDGAGDWRALFTGDAERDQLEQIIEAGAGAVDILKVGHHGSGNALDAGQAEQLSPAIALVSCGAGNRYGHPAAATVVALEAAGACVLRTDESGDVSCRLAPGGIAVDTLR